MSSLLSSLFGPRILLLPLLLSATASASVAVDKNGENYFNQERRRAIIGGGFTLYNLSPFALSFTSDGPPISADDAKDESLRALKETLVDVTSTYLEDFFVSKMVAMTKSIGSMHSIDLESALRVSTSMSQGQQGDGVRDSTAQDFHVEMYGTVAIVPNGDAPTSPTEMKQLTDSFLEDAFSSRAIRLYEDRLVKSENPTLALLESLSVAQNIESTMEPPPLPENTVITEGSSKRWDSKEFLLCFLLGGFLVMALGFLYAYIRNDYYQRIDKEYMREHQQQASLNESPTVTDDDYDDEEGQFVSGSAVMSPSRKKELSESIQSNSNPVNNGTGGDKNVIPVPAEQQNVSGTISRRYMQPASPLEVLYGATFLHQDRELVERAKQQRKKQKYIKKTYRKPIKPMLAIEESESDFGANNSYRSGVPVATWLQQLASMWDPESSGDQDGNTPTSKNESNLGPSPTGAEEFPFAFQDFPRKDGTPCLIYKGSQHSRGGNSISSSSNKKDTMRIVGIGDSTLEPKEVYIQENSYHSTGSMLSSTGSAVSEASTGSAAENFVSKLENLMVMRHRQFEERQRQEQERAAFRQKIQERKKQRAMAASAVNEDDQDSVGEKKIESLVDEDGVSVGTYV